MEEWLINWSTHHEFWVYFLIIALAFVEGPIVSMILGVLIKLGYFHFAPVYAALMVGDVLGDSTWYVVGRTWGHKFIAKFGKYVSVTEDKVEKMIHLFHRHKHYILIISKITNGFGLSFVTLLSAGMAKIPFFFYFTLNLIGQFIWTGILIGVGYFFSNLYMEVNGIMGKIGVVVGFIVLIALFLGFMNYMKQRTKSM